MVKWVQALKRTRGGLMRGLGRVLSGGRKVDEDTLEELEESLIRADVSPRMAMEWMEQLQKAYRGLNVDARDVMRNLLQEALAGNEPFDWSSLPSPGVFLLVGINGAGKTTTCAKLAHQARQHGLKPLLGATDTFRAAGSDQLKLWAEMVGCDVVGGNQGGDAAAVAYDALDAAIARQCNAVFIDTAGRMHTKSPLMDELRKVSRAMQKCVPSAPHETWIVLDAAMGQNAIEQARVFHDATPLTGAVVTKLDGSSKGGFLFSIHRELGIPVRMVGLGEQVEDLVPFRPDEFVEALLADDDTYPASV
jgi:fused signal recognition particle receptor